MDVFNITTPPPTYWDLTPQVTPHVMPPVTPNVPRSVTPFRSNLNLSPDNFFGALTPVVADARFQTPQDAIIPQHLDFTTTDGACNTPSPSPVPSPIPAHQPPSIKTQRKNAVRQRRFQERMNRASAQMNALRLQRSIMLS